MRRGGAGGGSLSAAAGGEWAVAVGPDIAQQSLARCVRACLFGPHHYLRRCVEQIMENANVPPQVRKS